MNRKVMDAIERHRMLKPGDAVVVGVSGGADSMALLHVLCNLPLGLVVTAAHLNHGIRGGEADRDEARVADFCKSLGVPLEIRRADIPAAAKSLGQNLEEAGRGARYAFFEELAERSDARIATGHTQSDSVETVLFNLMRGSGLSGVCGIPPVRGRIVRPLIACTRADTERYCLSHGIGYVDDSTNFSGAYTRNRIRRELLPLMEDICPGAGTAIARFSALSRDEDALLDSIAQKALADCGCDGRSVDAGLLSAQEDCIVLRAVRRLYRDAFGASLDYTHAMEVQALIKSGGGRVQLPRGRFALLGDGRLFFSPATPVDPGAAQTEPIPLASGKDGAALFENMTISLDLLTRSEYDNVHELVKNSTFDYDKIQKGLFVRSRRDGDRFWPGRGTASLKKRLINAKHPREKRGLIPLVCDGDRIVFVPGYGVDSAYAPGPDTVRFAVITVKGEGYNDR